MKRSVYSLVLSDDVIEAIDNMAYSLGTSRSNLINQILAEKVSLITPEKRMDNIFSQIEKLMFEECYQIQERQSDSLMYIRSSIKYKYRPTVRYSVELFRNSSDGIGQLKVTFRTQNQMLLKLIDGFFNLWTDLESTYLNDRISSLIEVGRFTRVFTSTSSDIGVAISEYIHTFDTALKQYFNNPNDISPIKDTYEKYLSNGITII
ncbi:MAG: hypothetical protein LIO71_06740 [Ruminococcus sp.]|nr:hypothetical protein [Ruminococcus sp.]